MTLAATKRQNPAPRPGLFFGQLACGWGLFLCHSLSVKVLQQSLPAGIAVSREVIRRVRSIIRKRPTPLEFMARVRAVLAEYEPMLAATISDSLLAGWLSAGKQLADNLELPDEEETNFFPSPSDPHPPDEPPVTFEFPEPEDEPVITFPIIEEAAEALATKRLLTQPEFEALSDRMKEQAFTVAKVASLDALEKIQEALVEDLREGGSHQEFFDKVEEAVGKSALSGPHIENVYRTNIAIAIGEGQQAVLDNPYVNSAFPYVMVRVTNDGRTRKSHRWFATGGIEGGPIFRADDPVIRKRLAMAESGLRSSLPKSRPWTIEERLIQATHQLNCLCLLD